MSLVASLPPTDVQNEKMSTKDVYMFPVIGSCVLFGLYLVFKFISKDYINIVIGAYFLIFSVAALTATLTPIARWLLRLPQNNGRTKYEHKLKIPFVTGSFALCASAIPLSLTRQTPSSSTLMTWTSSPASLACCSARTTSTPSTG